MALDIAIVGMACRFPGAADVDAFWRNLCAGHESVRHFTDDELLAAGTPPHVLANPAYVRAGQTLADADMFDAEHFGITADDAEILDPQHRQFLECAHEALEHSGYDPNSFDGSIGVFAGAGMNTHLLHGLYERYLTASGPERYRLMIANDKDFLATRLSYKLGLRGPSMSVNTACSTSLVAVHQAVMSLVGGECEIALAGGVHVRTPQVEGYLHQEGMILSPDGHCRPFDAAAQGTVLGSGVGIVVLKRLADAVRDGDHIHAVIKGSAVNNDGAAKSGYTAPSVEGQAAVITEAQAVAGISPDTISYVEAHGTGTPLGDPIELAALTEAFGPGLPAGGCAIGSVKSNIGHLDAASGVAGLIKTALMLDHAKLVPSLHFTSLNPEIDATTLPFRVSTETADWQATVRRAGVSSFGIGGTNAHVVLEQAPAPVVAERREQDQLLVLSARTPSALETATERLSRYLRAHPELELDDVAHTLAVGRRAHRYRRAVRCSGDVRSAALTLAIGDENNVVTATAEAAPRFGFTFAATIPGAIDLYDELPAFALLVDSVAARSGAGNARQLLSTSSPTAAFVTQLALTELLLSWGISSAAVRGGLGELVIACLSGTSDLHEALAKAEGHAAVEFASGDPVALWVDLGDVATGRGPLLSALALVWAAGAGVDWQKVYADERARRVPLPTYPFERKRYSVGTQTAVVEQPRQLLTDEASIVGYVQEEVMRIFGAQDGPPDPDQDVFELGLDSLVLIDISAKLGAELGRQVPASAFAEHPTIRGFVGALMADEAREPVTAS
ncbi:beta-ketoacyl synthase N-terminal-like domain-containing protein [Lentzea sp. BCCO 10_0856]|uniref:Beta-ketoacyl synthase N-terminal-like domain-containing protein n=1 Tax=Lentzea miocenica TaxID=3095431 RepID=A0ABU4TEV9_9PSEU|nr:beta-ketoacyl synthase N-terminal-like domain-containing protein [Lentzea sp. BCCO 10_0856]MDX8036721.1 beta-ketoacyl synthase N-terminal-like domain-containing protein [Lentzea sp. BCCO 10_0856]